MLSDATGALAHLDADALESMSVRALAIERRGRPRISPACASELTARLRVFAAAMQATRSNLDFMQGIAHSPGCGVNSGAGLGRGMRWDR